MKALTLHQPYASLVAHGHKSIETRSWQTSYRGQLAIHAAKQWAPGWLRWLDPDGPDGWKLEALDGINAASDEDSNAGRYYHPRERALPLGVVVATARLVDCLPIAGPHESRAGLAVRNDNGMLWMVRDGEEIPPFIFDQSEFGDFTPGRWAWLLADIQRLHPPIPARGRQGMWEWTP